MNRYYDFKQKQEKEFNSFPIMFAFNNNQFDEGCKKLGIEPSEAKDKLYSAAGGGYYLKSDSEKLQDMMRRFDAERAEAMKDPAFVLDAFTYELENYEYCITGNPADALSVFNLSIREVMEDPMLKECFTAAIKTASVERGSYIDSVLQA